MQSEFSFGDAIVRVPPPAFPAGAAAFEHQRANGVGMLLPMPASSSSGTSNDPNLNGAFLPAATAYKVWPCAHRLAEWLYDATKRGLLQLPSGTVIELGAGCGLCGLAMSKAGAQKVVLSELPENVPRLQELIAINAAQASCYTCGLDWTQPLPPAIAATRWDAIIAADCVFWPSLFKPLLSTIDALMRSGGGGGLSVGVPPPRVFLAMTDRLGRAQEFATIAREAGWELVALTSPAPAGSDLQSKGNSGNKAPPPGSLEAMRREACELYEMVRRGQ